MNPNSLSLNHNLGQPYSMVRFQSLLLSRPHIGPFSIIVTPQSSPHYPYARYLFLIIIIEFKH